MLLGTLSIIFAGYAPVKWKSNELKLNIYTSQC
jgi:hypothetical protein